MNNVQRGRTCLLSAQPWMHVPSQQWACLQTSPWTNNVQRGGGRASAAACWLSRCCCLAPLLSAAGDAARCRSCRNSHRSCRPLPELREPGPPLICQDRRRQHARLSGSVSAGSGRARVRAGYGRARVRAGTCRVRTRLGAPRLWTRAGARRVRTRRSRRVRTRRARRLWTRARLRADDGRARVHAGHGRARAPQPWTRANARRRWARTCLLGNGWATSVPSRKWVYMQTFHGWTLSICSMCWDGSE